MTSPSNVEPTTVVAPDGLALSRLPAAVYVFRISPGGVPSFPYVSQACADIYGFDAPAAMTDVRLMHEAVHPDDRQRFDDAGQHSLRTLTPIRWEGRITRRDGSERVVLITSRPERQVGGGTEWVGVVTERAPTATETWDRAPLARSHTDALAMLGHDVGGPLTVIMTSAELALELLAASSSVLTDTDLSLLRRRLASIVRQAHRLNELRDDLLALAAADADSVRARPEQLDVLPYLRAAADIDTGTIRLKVDCPADLYCTVQSTHLVQMLSNLVANASRYATSEVQISAIRLEARVLISIQDDGPGVTDEVAGRLFRRFAHADAIVRPQGAGTGLGLYIVHTLAAANLGTVMFSPCDPGARFTLDLPAEAPAPAPVG